jgi:hypothetical protein
MKSLWYSRRWPARATIRHDCRHTEKSVADHDGETSISPSSTSKLPTPLTTLLTKILLMTDFGLWGRAVETKWRHFTHTTSDGSRWASKSDTKTSGCQMRHFFKPSRPVFCSWRHLASIGVWCSTRHFWTSVESSPTATDSRRSTRYAQWWVLPTGRKLCHGCKDALCLFAIAPLWMKGKGWRSGNTRDAVSLHCCKHGPWHLYSRQEIIMWHWDVVLKYLATIPILWTFLTLLYVLSYLLVHQSY